MFDNKSDNNTMAILMGGIAAGIIGSRLLPPLFAMASGAGRVRAGGDPFALLMEDHKQILATLDKMIAASDGSTIQKSRLFLSLKRKLGKHAMAEEDVVYPLLHNQGNNSDESKHLYDEHADMKIHLFEIEEMLMSGSDWSSAVRRLRQLIRQHVEEEEQVVFPTLRQSVNKDKLPTVSGQIRREEALIV